MSTFGLLTRYQVKELEKNSREHECCG